MNEDLTIIYLTNNKLPDGWVKFHRECLLKAAGNYPIIEIARVKGPNTNIVQTEPESSSNIYWQVLKGAKLATTEYVAVAEDDTLYTKEHFSSYRNPKAFAYNYNRWSIYTWGEPIYSLKNFIKTNAVLIAPRKMLVEALEERFTKYPHDMKDIPVGMCGEVGYYEAKLGVTLRKAVEFKTIEPVVQFDHDYFTGDNSAKGLERRHKKILGTIRAYDIPVWGRAEELVKKFK